MNKIMLGKTILVVLVCAIGFSLGGKAKADGVYFGGWSKHFDEKKWEKNGWKVNSNQKFLALEFNGFIGGHYTNSFGDSTYLAAKYLPLYSGHNIAFGGYIGATHGYKFCSGDKSISTKSLTCFTAIPEIRFTKYDLQPSLLIMKNGVALSLKLSFE